MDPFGLARKKLRPEAEFVNGNGGIHTHTHALADVGTRRFNPPDIMYGDPARFKQPPNVPPVHLVVHLEGTVTSCTISLVV